MFVSTTIIEKALREADIEDLLSAGAPADEYTAEAQEIFAALGQLSRKDFTEQSIIAIIALVWTKAFDRTEDEITARMPVFQQIARKILDHTHA